MSEEKDMRIYQCQMPTCGYMYMPTKGDRKGKIPAGTSFEDLPLPALRRNQVSVQATRRLNAARAFRFFCGALCFLR